MSVVEVYSDQSKTIQVAFNEKKNCGGTSRKAVFLTLKKKDECVTK